MSGLAEALLWIVVAAGGLVVTFLAWVWGVRRSYRPAPDASRRLRAVCSDGWPLAVYHRPAAQRRFAEPILLCHGLAANRYNFDLDPPHSLSGYLSEAGFDCFVVEWRGTGGSRRHPPGRVPMGYTVDDHIDRDGPALLDLALAETGAPRAFWLGHSLGGLVGYGMAQSPHGSRLAGLVTLGSPVELSPDPLVRRLLRIGIALSWPWAFRQELVTAAFAPFAGRLYVRAADRLANTREIAPHVQRQLLAHQIASIGRPMLLQFADWIEASAFRSVDRTRDFREGLSRVTLPVLCAAGSVDHMAPPDAVGAGHERLGSTDKTLVVFGTQQGYAADYGHADLVFGRSAPAEVYPLLTGWLEARATRLSGTMPGP